MGNDTSEDLIINKGQIMLNFFTSQEKMEDMSGWLGGVWTNGEPEAMPGVYRIIFPEEAITCSHNWNLHKP